VEVTLRVDFGAPFFVWLERDFLAAFLVDRVLLVLCFWVFFVFLFLAFFTEP
jgi:hypothetical protein